MGGEPEVDRVREADPGAGQREMQAGAGRKPRQKPGGADIREEADADLGHREHDLLARDPVRTMERHTDAAAHDDAVDQRDIGLREPLDPPVQAIFVAVERVDRGELPGLDPIDDRADIAARRERLRRGRADHDMRDGGVGLEPVQRGVDRADHLVGQRVERFRPLERDHPGVAARFDEDLAHLRPPSDRAPRSAA
jgi:hypothetical protein